MSLIINQPKTLKNISLILISDTPVNKIIKHNEHIIKLLCGDKLVGINIKNAEQYFKVQEGSHVLSKEQKAFFKKEGISFEYEGLFETVVVKERQPHPKSDKLFILKVQGKQEYIVVTNVKSIQTSQKIVIAKEGAIIPSGGQIRKSKIMGVESSNMVVGSKTIFSSDENEFAITNKEVGEDFLF